MWTAETLDWKSNLVNFSATVRFTDGTITDNVPLQCADEADKNAQIAARLDLLNKHEAAKAEGLTKGPFVAPVVKVPDPLPEPAPVPIDLKRQAFYAAYSQLQRFDTAIRLGIMAADDAAYKQATSDAQANFDVTYL